MTTTTLTYVTINQRGEFYANGEMIRPHGYSWKRFEDGFWRVLGTLMKPDGNYPLCFGEFRTEAEADDLLSRLCGDTPGRS